MRTSGGFIDEDPPYIRLASGDAPSTDRRRYNEFSSFLDWLEDTLGNEKIDTLIVAGDIFDTGTPGNRAQELYYRFLCRVSSSTCRHIVISSGNHDSPSFLDAPRCPSEGPERPCGRHRCRKSL